MSENDDALFIDDENDFDANGTITNKRRGVLRKTAAKKHDDNDDESGICMKKYRRNVIHWLDAKPMAKFGENLKGFPQKEVSRHLLALLHLANEEELEILSEPFVMDTVFIKKSKELF